MVVSQVVKQLWGRTASKFYSSSSHMEHSFTVICLRNGAIRELTSQQSLRTLEIASETQMYMQMSCVFLLV